MVSKWQKDYSKDLSLDSHTIKHWIMDDGTISKSKGHLRLCTCSFSVEECERLSEMLNDFIGADNASHVIEQHKYRRIYVPKKFTQQLLQKVGNCEVNCFRYKWNHNSVGG